MMKQSLSIPTGNSKIRLQNIKHWGKGTYTFVIEKDKNILTTGRFIKN